MTVDPRRRFSGRVADYVRHRPGYPRALVDLLVDRGALTAMSTVADVGSGTGLLSRLFLEQGNAVIGVEPNREMREAGRAALRSFARFRSVDGSAERTNLPAASVGLVVAGQAFHWFDPRQARTEFERILEPDGAVGLVWNDRVMGDRGVMDGYERIVEAFGTDYGRVDHRRLTPPVFDTFFGSGSYAFFELPHAQELDHEGLRGRLLSCSYIPAAGQPGHDEVMRAAQALFDDYQREGRVVLRYTTKLYLGKIR